MSVLFKKKTYKEMIRKNQEENQDGIWDINRWVCCLEKKHINNNIKGIQNNNN